MKLVTFYNTTTAMMFEDVAKENEFQGRLIPLPPSIGAGCGFSWLTNSNSQQINSFIVKNQLEYEDIYDYKE
ncbi:MAG: hypothetical protein BEN19_08230 [Epulopiscium sp. Nuni2H_MBin003]|nr:MAG: hypothetical protein BEN19_08230 [Epulopiscium sp. Nuni2H_MBin003]